MIDAPTVPSPGAQDRRERDLRAGSRAPQWLLATVFLLLAGATVELLWENVRWHRETEQLVARLGLATRRPAEIQAMRLEAAGDLEADLLAAAALEDLGADGGADLSEDARVRLGEIRQVLLAAVIRRPGRAYHLFLLARVECALAGVRSVDSWFDVMQVAARGAPGSDEIWDTFGKSLLGSWATLSPGQRARAPAILQRSLTDPDFVTSEFLRVRTLLGPETTLSLLPNEPSCLEAAEQALRAAGKADEAAAVAARSGRPGPP